MIIVLVKYLKNIKALNFILIGYASILLISIVFGLIAGSFNTNPLYLRNKYLVFFSGVLIAPILETIIFQAIPFYFKNKYLRHKKNFFLYLFLTPILFIHNFNLAYILISYLVGLIFTFMYYVAHYRKENPIILISLIHLINNLLVYCVRYLF